MSNRHVHFSTPLETFEEQNAALDECWGNFVPVDQWTPQKSGPNSKYDMSAESRIDTVDNIWGDETPDAYDRVFAGLDEYMDDIHEMIEKDLERIGHPGHKGSPSTVDVEALREDGPSYDLGWSQEAGSSATESSVLGATSHIATTAYDLGWGASATQQDVFNGPTYDLGWGVPIVGQNNTDGPITVAKEPIGDVDSGMVYDLGWGVSTSVEPEGRDMIDLTAEDQPDGPAYDFGWEITVDEYERSKPDASASSGSSGGHSQPHIVSDENEESHSSVEDPNAADLLGFRVNRRLKGIGHDMGFVQVAPVDTTAEADVQNGRPGVFGGDPSNISPVWQIFLQWTVRVWVPAAALPMTFPSCRKLHFRSWLYLRRYLSAILSFNRNTIICEISRRIRCFFHSINEFIAAQIYTDSSYEDLDNNLVAGGPHLVSFRSEHSMIQLPSNFGIVRCAELGIASLVRQEITLREVQANDILQALSEFT
ncbi:hypothetical protein BDR07DRAFT_1383800 [Suillus spraguei]|nr:hypothetical protein BDR07DRAFT_1383800 [Suillus spraguei]